MQTTSRAMMRAPRVGPVAARLWLPAQHRSVWRQTARCLISEQVNCSNQHLLDDVSHQQQEQMSRFIDILLEGNKVVNLTAIRDREEAVRRHVLDSLALLPVIEGLGATDQGQDAEAAMQLRLVDVGSGAGLPGLILAIARPHWQVTLLDSLGKRCRFVEAAMMELGIANANVVWARAEEAGREANMREGFDVAVARAVVEMRVLVEYCVPLLTVGGWLVAAKGANSEEEVALAGRAIQTVGGQLVGVHPVQSWTAAGQCQAVVVRKTRPTPQAYPRLPGVPKKSPL